MIKEYIKYNLKALALFVGILVLCGIILISFGVDLRLYIYILVLSLTLYMLFFMWDYHAFKDKHRSLVSLAKNSDCNLDGMPAAANLLEEDYQTVIETVHKKRLKDENYYTKKYNKMIGYYNIWAHQIKTPIAAIRLLLQSKENDPARYNTEETYKEISGEILKIEQYVEMVLCYLRLDGDTSDFVFKEYELDKIIKQAVRKFSNQFIRSRNRLVYNPTTATIITDEKWLLFVIEQILSNALKYTKQGTVRIYTEEPGILAISDTGIGIAGEDLPRIFECGYTGYNGRADKKSTGIGLYLCKRIADSLGNSIWAESSVGQGTTVKIDLRRKKLGQLE